MKKIIFLASMILWAIGGFAMTKEEMRYQLIEDGRDESAIGTLEETQDILKNKLLNKYGFSESEVISLAKEYVLKFPSPNKNPNNLLDRELRRIANLESSYFRPFDVKAAKEKLDSFPLGGSSSGGILSWLKWIVIAAAAIGGGYAVKKAIQANQKKKS